MRQVCQFCVAGWFDNGSEEALQNDLEKLSGLKQQTAEDFDWLLHIWHENLNLRGWAEVLGVGACVCLSFSEWNKQQLMDLKRPFSGEAWS